MNKDLKTPKDDLLWIMVAFILGVILGITLVILLSKILL